VQFGHQARTALFRLHSALAERRRGGFLTYPAGADHRRARQPATADPRQPVDPAWFNSRWPFRTASRSLGLYAEVAARHPEAAVIVPPRSGAVPSDSADTAPTQRDRHIEAIAEHGRMGWQKASGYNWRALVEADIARFKRVIGDGLRSHTDGRQATEVAIAVQVLNRMLELGRPEYVRTA
jgi:hypothetical protein